MVTLTDIHRMTGFPTQDCCRTTVFARASPLGSGSMHQQVAISLQRVWEAPKLPSAITDMPAPLTSTSCEVIFSGCVWTPTPGGPKDRGRVAAFRSNRRFPIIDNARQGRAQ